VLAWRKKKVEKKRKKERGLECRVALAHQFEVEAALNF
jgi:hypothetical protein